MVGKHSYFYAFLFFLLTAATFLFFVSECSPIYPINDWMDTNVYLNVAKRLLQGGTLYRDIYDIKGLYFYQLHEFACLISTRSFVGVLLMEIMSGGSYLYVCFLSIQDRLRTNRRYHFAFGILLTLICAFIYYSSGSIRRGDSAEELCLPLLAFGLYLVDREIRLKESLSPHVAVLIGLMSGLLFWIKYSLLGLYCGLALFMIIYHFLKKDYRILARTIVLFLIGVIVTSIPVILYFWWRDSLNDLLYYYFIQPLSGYNTHTGILVNSSSRQEFFVSQTTGILVILLFFLKTSRSERTTRTIILFAFPVTFISTCLLPNFWKYYAIPLYVFVPYGISVAGEAVLAVQNDSLRKIFSNKQNLYIVLAVVAVCGFPYYLKLIGIHNIATTVLHNSLIKLIIIALVLLLWVAIDFRRSSIKLPILLIAFVLLSYSMYEYSYLAFKSKDQLPQYQFAETINQTENAKLLVYGAPDYGFFWAANLVPQFQFSEVVNIDQEAVTDVQLTYILAEEPDYIVSLDPLCPLNESFYHYKLIEYHLLYRYGNSYFNFYLYGRSE